MNKATRINVATLGTIFGISGMSHGFFETLQGNVSTGSLFIFAIGEAQKMWPYGNEPALTLLPTFLLAGLSSMIVGLAIIIWSLGFVHMKNGPIVLILLFVLLLLVGGGVAQILFFPFIWLVSTCINQPLTWWRRILPVQIQKLLTKLWPWSLGISAGLLVFALEIATTGFVPGVNDPEAALSVMLFCLGMEVITFPLTFVTGFASDIVSRPNIILNAGVLSQKPGSSRQPKPPATARYKITSQSRAGTRNVQGFNLRGAGLHTRRQEKRSA